jgi:hypothetical protein
MRETTVGKEGRGEREDESERESQRECQSERIDWVRDSGSYE